MAETPCDAPSNPIPALKRRAIFRLSLRDKLVCALFILVSIPTAIAMRKYFQFRAATNSCALTNGAKRLDCGDSSPLFERRDASLRDKAALKTPQSKRSATALWPCTSLLKFVCALFILFSKLSPLEPWVNFPSLNFKTEMIMTASCQAFLKIQNFQFLPVRCLKN